MIELNTILQNYGGSASISNNKILLVSYKMLLEFDAFMHSNGRAVHHFLSHDTDHNK